MIDEKYIRTAETPYGIFSYWAADGIGKSIAQGNFWEPFLKDAFDSVAPNSLVIDAGANIGWWTIYAAKRGNKVWAFEPCSEVFQILCLNVHKNGLSERAGIFPWPLYSTTCDMEIVPLGEGNPAHQVIVDGEIDVSVCSNSGSLQMRPGTSKVFSHWGVPIDFLKLRDVGLIKIDTEGCDFEILKGAEETIRRCSPILCYEYLSETRDQDSLNEMDSFVRVLGYLPEQVYEGMEGRYKEFVARKA